MIDFIISSLAAIFIILPIVLFALVFIIAKQFTNNKRSARNLAINITTIALIFSVHFIIIAIWSKSMMLAIFLFMLFTAIIFTILYWKLKDEIVYAKVFIGYWRLNFLLFSIIYVVLLLYGMTTRIIEAVAV